MRLLVLALSSFFCFSCATLTANHACLSPVAQKAQAEVSQDDGYCTMVSRTPAQYHGCMIFRGYQDSVCDPNGQVVTD